MHVPDSAKPPLIGIIAIIGLLITGCAATAIPSSPNVLTPSPSASPVATSTPAQSSSLALQSVPVPKPLVPADDPSDSVDKGLPAEPAPQPASQCIRGTITVALTHEKGPCPVYDSINPIFMQALQQSFNVTLKPGTDSAYPGEHFIGTSPGYVTGYGGYFTVVDGLNKIDDRAVPKILKQLVVDLGGQTRNLDSVSSAFFQNLPIGSDMLLSGNIGWDRLYKRFHVSAKIERVSKVRVVLTFDDGPHTPTADADNHTLKVMRTLRAKISNGVADNIKGVFFVQTGVPTRGGSRKGLEVLAALSKEHLVEIHTGSKEDHIDHVQRLAAGLLEIDLSNAQDRLSEIGMTADYVRPPYGKYNLAVKRVYEKAGLKMALWNVDSLDNSPISGRRRTVEEVITALQQGVQKAIKKGDRDLVVLFHDINGTTADNLPTYLQTIMESATEVAGKSYNVEFVTNVEEIRSILDSRPEAR